MKKKEKVMKFLKNPSDKELIAQLKGDSYLRVERFRGSFCGSFELIYLL